MMIKHVLSCAPIIFHLYNTKSSKVHASREINHDEEKKK